MKNPPPLTFLVHNNSRLRQFEDSNARIRIIEGGSQHNTNPINVEVMPTSQEPEVYRGATTIHYRYQTLVKNPNQSGLQLMQNSTAMELHEPIRNYILPQASRQVVPTLQQLKNRFRHDSTIVFFQWNVGLIEILNREVFPDPHTRPNYMSGRLKHSIVSLPLSTL